MDKLKLQLGWYGFGASVQGNSGGLAFFWRKNLDISLNCYSSSFIDVTVNWDGLSWHLMGFYGHPKPTKRELSLDILRKLSTMSRLPWVCFGDYCKYQNFNYI